MAGYIGSKSSVTQVDGYNRTEADDEFVNDPNSVISVSGSNVGIGTSSPDGSDWNGSSTLLHLYQNSTNGSLLKLESSNTSAVMAAGNNQLQLGTIEAQPFNFYTSATERMRIDSSGRVMIGTTTEGQVQAQNLTIAASGNMGMTLRSTTSAETSVFFSDGTSGTAEYAGWLQYAHASNSMTFGTNATERMRIDSNGSILFNTTTLSNGSNNSMSYSNTGDEALIISSAGTGGSYMIRFMNGNGEVGSIISGGSSTSYNTSSDYRLKTDAQPMTGASARVQALNPVNFEWIADGTRVDGFLAHEAQEVVPEAVSGTKDAMRDEEYEVTPAVLDDDGNVVTEAVMGTRSVPKYQGIDQSKLVPLLTAALQEALTKIDTMETRLAALEAV